MAQATKIITASDKNPSLPIQVWDSVSYREPKMVSMELSPTKSSEHIKTGSGEIAFDIPGQKHLYLSTSAESQFPEPPASQLFRLKPDAYYALSGIVEQEGPPCRLWLMEYNKHRRISYQIQELFNGRFELSWKTHHQHHGLRIALKVVGKGTLKLSNLRIEKTGELSLGDRITKKLQGMLPAFLSKRISARYFKHTLQQNNTYDYQKYIEYSGSLSPQESAECLQGHMIKDGHAIEKGLTFARPKLGFGKVYVKRLLRDTERYIRKAGFDDFCQVNLDILREYHDFNEKNGISDKKLLQSIERLQSLAPSDFASVATGGSVIVRKEEIQEAVDLDFGRFMEARHSVRDFSEETVPHELIERAVQIARSAPSVCNRQSWKLHLYSGEQKDEILKLQGGNRGFGHKVSTAIVVAGSLHTFSRVAERNQIFVDGGIFAMSLVLSLHSLGLGTCMMSLASDYQKEEIIKQVGNIPSSQRCIMVVGVGMLPDTFKVCESSRRPVSEILQVHKGEQWVLRR